MSLVMVDAWSAGHYGNEPAEDKGSGSFGRLSWVRSAPMDNGYARPIEGVVTVIDLNRKEVVRVEDHGIVPLPPKPGNWGRSSIPHPRTDLKPLDVSQPDGPSFTVTGHEVRWQKWALRVGFNPREGLVLNTVTYDGRPDPLSRVDRRDARSLRRPQGVILPQERLRPRRVRPGYDGQLAGPGMRLPGDDPLLRRPPRRQPGRVVTIKNAVCLHEEDFGMLWKHTDWRTNQTEVRRSRRLAVSMIATVGNYDYGFYWYFYQDGTIQMEVKLTGIMNTMALKPDEPPATAPKSRLGSLHPTISTFSMLAWISTSTARPTRPRKSTRGAFPPAPTTRTATRLSPR